MLVPLAYTRGGQSDHELNADRRKAEYLYLEAENARQAKDYSNAIRLFERAYRHNPADTAYGREFSIMQLATFSQLDSTAVAEAIDRLEGYMAANPANPDYGVVLQSAYRDRGDTLNYLRVLRTVHEARPTDPDWAMTYARAYMALSNSDRRMTEGIALLRRLEQQVFPQDIQNPASWSIFEAYAQNGETLPALIQLQKIYRRSPDNIEMLTRMSNGMLALGMADSARLYLDRVRELEPDYDPLPMMYLDLYSQTGDTVRLEQAVLDVLHAPQYDGAAKAELMRSVIRDYRSAGALRNPFIERALKAALAADPDNAEMKRHLVAYYSLVERYADADRVNDELIAAMPDDDRNRFAKLAIWNRLHGLEREIELARKFYRSQPDNMTYLVAIGGDLHSAGRIDEAISLMGEVRTDLLRDDSTRSVYHTFMGDLYSELPDTARAYDEYRRAIAVDSTNYMAFNNLAYKMSISGNPALLPEAERLARYAADNIGKVAQSGQTSLLDTYGWIKYLQGDYENARTLIGAAVGQDEACNVLLKEYAAEQADPEDHTPEVTEEDTVLFRVQAPDYPADGSDRLLSVHDVLVWMKYFESLAEEMRQAGFSDSDLKSASTLLDHLGDIEVKVGSPRQAQILWIMAYGLDLENLAILDKIQNKTK